LRIEDTMAVRRTCYMCEKEATSKEHVPPRCFFPENKDSVSGKDLRVNLITVPSCDMHNVEKSGDDLYLLHVIVSAYQNNIEGQRLFTKRIEKTGESRPYLLKTFFGEFHDFLANGKPISSFKLDMERFNSGMTYMANAIYFAHFKTKWHEALEILVPSARFSERIPKYKQGNVFLARFEQMDVKQQKYGANQDIFFYQFINGVSLDHRLLRMVFYQGFVVLAIPLKRKEYIMKK